MAPLNKIPYNLEHELEVQEVRDELDIDLVPGTEVMTDLRSMHFVSDSKHHVLIPHPSDDPRDPLNWTKTWKVLLATGSFLTAFINALGPLSIAPQAPALMIEWDRSLSDILQFSGICILVLGFSNFFWVPLATKYGRRVALIFSTLIGTGACIWRAEAKSYNSFMGAVVIHGFSVGVCETISPMIISDVFFLHERGSYMTLYMWSYFSALILGPVFAGIMTDRYGWRSFWWLTVAAYVFLLAWCVFLVPETSWDRRAPLPVQTTTEVAADKTPDEMIEHTTEEVLRDEKDVTVTSPVTAIAPHDVVNQLAPVLHKGMPSRGQFAPICIGENALNQSIFRALWTPVVLFTFPIVQWGSFVFSWSSSCLLFVNLTQSQVFSAPPYNFNSTQVGYTNFAIFVGATIGLLVTGPFSDWISMRATKKNKGIREPEMRLPALIPFALVIIVQMTIVGVGYQRKWHWAIIVVIGYTLTGFQVASIPSIASTYAVDSYTPVAGYFFVSATVNKNLWGYGVSKFVTPWTISSGFIIPFMTNAAIMFFILLVGIVYYYYGKTFRRWTRNSSVHDM